LGGGRAECAFCKTPLTPENTKPGFGVCTWSILGDYPMPACLDPLPGKIHMNHDLVCLSCAPRAKEVNEGNGIYIFDGDMPSIFPFLGYDQTKDVIHRKG